IGLGARSVSALLEALYDLDVDFRKVIIVTLGEIGPAAAPAVPALRAFREDPWLGPWAGQALAKIKPPVIAPIVTRLKSPWTWTRLIDFLLLVLTHPVAAFFSMASTVFALVHWYAALATSAGEIAPSVSASFALLGACVGGTIGAKAHGLAGAKIGVKIC